MKVLLVTSSARGHAIADALKRSSHNPEIIHVCPSRNPGIRPLAEEQVVIDSIMDFDAILDVAKRTKPDFAFVAPDDPIGGGLVDALEEVGVQSVAPKKSLARIESSKSFTRELLKKHSIDVSPDFRVFTEAGDELHSYLQDDLQGNYVVKYDGLAGGKGVKVSEEHLYSIDEGVEFAAKCLEDSSQVVIEEKLIGCEFSLMSFASGSTVVSMPAVQDHKRAYEGDTGPNTGGMGTYSDANHSLPFLEQSDIDAAHECNVRTAEALQQECGEPFRGILYGGFIATAKGVQLIEYNARFGDPEVLNVLPLLSSDFVDICLSMIRGELSQDLVQFEHKATVCKYIAPESYPKAKDQRGEVVTFPDVPENARIFYGDMSEDEDGTLRLGGSRTAGIVGIGETIADAENVAQALCQGVKGPIRFRDDIGTAALIDKRSHVMREIRG